MKKLKQKRIEIKIQPIFKPCKYPLLLLDFPFKNPMTIKVVIIIMIESTLVIDLDIPNILNNDKINVLLKMIAINIK